MSRPSTKKRAADRVIVANEITIRVQLASENDAVVTSGRERGTLIKNKDLNSLVSYRWLRRRFRGYRASLNEFDK